MADFDDLIKSRLDEFRDTAAPSTAEIDRMNIGLDELTRPSWIARWWWLLLAFLLLFVGQGWLIYSNWSLRRQVREITPQLNEDQQTMETDQERSSVQSNASSDDVNSVSPIDSHAIALIYIEKHGVNSGILEEAVAQVLIKIEKQLGQRYPRSTNTEMTALAIAESSPERSPVQDIERGISEIGDSLKRQNLGGRLDTVVVERIIPIDTALFDSLITKKMTEEALAAKGIETPTEVNWTASVGVKPGYSNLFLLDGRMVFDAQLVTGLEFNNRWAVNAGLKWRVISIHEYLEGDQTSALYGVLNGSGIAQEIIQATKEVEGSSYGWYTTVDAQYFFQMGRMEPFIRVGSDVNLFTHETYKIETASDDEYPINQSSRKVQLSTVFGGIGSRIDLNEKFTLDWEGGVIAGRSMTPVLINDKNGLYAQIRLVYLISH